MVDLPTLGIQVDKVGEEEREGGVVVGDDLGVDLGGMVDVLGLGCGVDERVEMGGREVFGWRSIWVGECSLQFMS